MFVDLYWPLNASRGFVSISWASCSYRRNNKAPTPLTALPLEFCDADFAKKSRMMRLPPNVPHCDYNQTTCRFLSNENYELATDCIDSTTWTCRQSRRISIQTTTPQRDSGRTAHETIAHEMHTITISQWDHSLTQCVCSPTSCPCLHHFYVVTVSLQQFSLLFSSVQFARINGSHGVIRIFT